MCCALLGVKEKVKGKTVKEKNNIKTKAKTHQPSEKKEEGFPAAWNPTPQRQITRTVFPSSSLCLFYEHILQLMLSCSLLTVTTLHCKYMQLKRFCRFNGMVIFSTVKHFTGVEPSLSCLPNNFIFLLTDSIFQVATWWLLMKLLRLWLKSHIPCFILMCPFCRLPSLLFQKLGPFKIDPEHSEVSSPITHELLLCVRADYQ